MKRHKFKTYRHPPGGIEICEVCGAQRVCTVPGYQKSATYLNGKKQRYCLGFKEVENEQHIDKQENFNRYRG